MSRLSTDDVRRLVLSVRGKPLAQCRAAVREIARGRAWAHVGYEPKILDRDEERLLAALLWDPSQLADVEAELPAEAFEDPVAKEVYLAMLAVGADLDDPVTLGLALETDAARALVTKVTDHPDALADGALGYARRVCAAWGERP